MSWRMEGMDYYCLYQVLLKGKRSTQKEIDGVCIIQLFIAWIGSVSSIYFLRHIGEVGYVHTGP